MTKTKIMPAALRRAIQAYIFEDDDRLTPALLSKVDATCFEDADDASAGCTALHRIVVAMMSMGDEDEFERSLEALGRLVKAGADPTIPIKKKIAIDDGWDLDRGETVMGLVNTHARTDPAGAERMFLALAGSPASIVRHVDGSVSFASGKPEPSGPIRNGCGFIDVTAAMVLVGRRFTQRYSSGADILAFFDRVTELTPDERFRFVAAQDLTRWEEWEQRAGVLEWALGIKVETGLADDGPAEFSLRSIRDAEACAATAITTEFVQGVADVLDPTSRAELLASRSAVYLAPMGPLASATVVYGVRKAAASACPDGWHRLQGLDRKRMPHRRAAYGAVVARADDWEVAECDISDAAHAARVSVVSERKAAYHIVARYD